MAIPVENELGVRFPSMNQAAKSVGRSAASIRAAVDLGHRCADLRWWRVGAKPHPLPMPSGVARTPKKGFPVIDNFGFAFKSASAAALALGVSDDHMRRCLSLGIPARAGRTFTWLWAAPLSAGKKSQNIS